MSDSMTASVATREATTQAGLWSAALFSFGLIFVFHVTSWSMVAIWLRSETFAHGILILPISLWLIWNQRESLRQINAHPAPWVAVLILPIGFVWLLATLVDVLVVQQLALVAMLIVGVWAILGHLLARAVTFPLLFLFLAVPMGEALVPPMMEFTATSTVWLIQLTGVPVYREGLYFTLPSGYWSVVEACSGVRYIIASVTLGLLYAYLTYRSYWRRLLFVLAAILVPVIANTLRAYMIVMLGHLSGMTVATGVDHLIYGWIFFGIVMFLLFWLGSFFRQDFAVSSADASLVEDRPLQAASGYFGLVATVIMAWLAAILWLGIAQFFTSPQSLNPTTVISPFEPADPWRIAAESGWNWQPENAVAGLASAVYQGDGKMIELVIQYPLGGTAAGELVGSSTRFSSSDAQVRVVERAKVGIQIRDETVVVDQAQLAGAAGTLLVWSWYSINGLLTSNDYVAKFAEAIGVLGWGREGSSRWVLVTPMQGSLRATQQIMQDFLQMHASQLDQAIYQDSGERP